MAKLAFEKPLKSTKVDRYSLDVSSWLDGQAITLFDIIAPVESGITVSDKTNDNGKLSALFEGATVGSYYIEFEYQTATRRDCQTVKLKVIADC